MRVRISRRARPAVERPSAEAAAAQERERIARELHDLVSHQLGIMVLQVGAAEQILGRDPGRAREVLLSVRDLGREAIAEMTMLLGFADPPARAVREPLPTLADLGRLVTARRVPGTLVDLQVTGTVRRRPAAIELAVYRAVQEGLAVGPGQAPRWIGVHVHHREHSVTVTIAHDCQNGENATDRLRTRVAVFGGTFHAGPRPEGGWLMRASFPVGR